MIATVAFAIIFTAPKKELIFCGISGAIGWTVYVMVMGLGGSSTFGNVLGTVALTLFSRILATTRKNPATVYLISGIFPLVPGAGIYYTAFYLITDNMTKFSEYGLLTLKTAGAIVMGIILGLARPQLRLNKAFAPSGQRSSHR